MTPQSAEEVSVPGAARRSEQYRDAVISEIEDALGESATVGFSADEIETGERTIAARPRWAVVIGESLPVGRQVNAAACVTAAIAASASTLLAHGWPDASDSEHLGLPWAGCSVYAADLTRVRRVRAGAACAAGVLVAAMPRAEQLTHVYDEYRAVLSETATESIDYAAVRVLGPRKAISKLFGSLQLL